MSVHAMQSERQKASKHFYLDWVLANAAAETIGIGAAALIAIQMSSTNTDIGAFHPLLIMLSVVLAGTLIEGVFVGLFQGITLRHFIPIWKWTLYTSIGAGIAWILGMLPSTIMELMSIQSDMTVVSEAGMNMAEVSPIATVLMAAGMGLVLGPFLAVPQWLLLRKALARPTWLWIPANMIAWAVGMIVIFGSMDYIPVDLSPLMAAIWGAGIGLVTGGIVGLIHGIVLNGLLQN